MAYLARTVDRQLDELLPGIAAIALEGARAIGKTATAEQRARTVYRLDDPARRELIEADPSRLTTGETPILIDEWQRIPASWDVVRRAVDEDPRGNRFLLTGSATPTGATVHSGAGRIVIVRMRPLTLEERLFERPSVRLSELMSGARPAVVGQTERNLKDYADAIVGSGFPGLRNLTDAQTRAQLDGYVDQIVEYDFPLQGGYVVRNPVALRRWLVAYAAASSTTASLETVRGAAGGRAEQVPARTTTSPYHDTLQRLWLVEPVPAWAPTRNRVARLSAPSKHQLVDPALAARLLGVGVDALLDGVTAGPAIPRDGTLLGALFESLATLCVRAAAGSVGATVGHLRTRGREHEIDLIVERDDGKVLAIETKLARSPDDGELRHLRWLRETIGEDLLDAVVLTTGHDAFRRPDGIAVVPLALFGA